MITMGIRLTICSAWSHKSENEISYQFVQERIVIGRGPGSDVRLPHRTVSEGHAVISLEGGDYAITDNGSTNGTAVNGARLTPERPKLISSGDLIEIGGYVLSVQTGVAVAQSTSADRTAMLARRLIREMKAASDPEVRPPRLTVLGGPQAGQRWEIPSAPVRLIAGRADSCQLVLSDPEVSPEHMEVIRDLDGVLVRSLAGTSGVLVGDQRISELRLKNGVELEIGSTRLLFEEPADESLQALCGEQDLPAPKAAPLSSEPSASDQGPGGAPDDSAEPAAARGAGRRKDRVSPAGADIFIYLLALIVIIASIAGLIVLLSSN